MYEIAVKPHRLVRAVTIIEAMVAMVVLVIVALGASAYQYHAARHARVARAQVIGARTAQLLLEDWKSTGGSTDYDPTALGLGFSSLLSSTTYSGGTIHGLYAVTVEDMVMLVGLNYDDVAHDSQAQVTLRHLEVIIQVGEISGIYSSFSGVSSYVSPTLHVSPISLTTYVRLDASGG